MNQTVEHILSWAVSQLKMFDTAKLDAEVLLAETVQQNRTWLKTWSDKALTPEQMRAFEEKVERRRNGEPVAYIVGRQDFWTLSLKVTPATLIPRPETEHLVELALTKVAPQDSHRIVDLGTGTGAIALAVASERPKARVWAMDLSADALVVAGYNRQKYKLDNVTCHQGHWLRDWQGEPFDLIMSNPPYIDQDDPHLQDLTFEPTSALVSAEQGLSDIKEITQQATTHLTPLGWLMFEHGYEQGPKVRAILQSHGFVHVETLSDYSGHDRVTCGQKPEL
ncbi:peptide chain release factor N(5)-glutamine methyltransferase [Kangiella geojedonensis]|nr:peptide chain release factor N(5)-glutamine methyltransferase [Kangiella geojedonensis]